MKGLEFKFYNDTTTSLKIDTIPIIEFVDFKKVEMHFQTLTNKPILFIELTREGKDKFAKFTKRNNGKPLAIILNDKLLSAPIVQAEIPNGQIEVSSIEQEVVQEITTHFERSK